MEPSEVVRLVDVPLHELGVVALVQAREGVPVEEPQPQPVEACGDEPKCAVAKTAGATIRADQRGGQAKQKERVRRPAPNLRTASSDAFYDALPMICPRYVNPSLPVESLS